MQSSHEIRLWPRVASWRPLLAGCSLLFLGSALPLPGTAAALPATQTDRPTPKDGARWRTEAECPPAGAPARPGGVAACLEEATFTARGLRLAAQWFTPPTPGPFPAVVVIRGSGPSARGNPWTESLVGVLLAEGVGILLPDKRGSDRSEGDWRTAHFEDLADDAVAAAGYLAGRPDVAAGRIGVMGLSQGGQIAPIAAARSDAVAFAISVVGGGVPFLENVRFEMERTFEEEGLSGARLEAAMEMVGAAVAYLRGSIPWETYAARLEGTREAIGDRLAHAYFLDTPDHWRWDFFRRHADFDPVEWWGRVEQPTLVLLGGADRNTPTDRTARRLRRAFEASGHPDAAVRVFEGLGHDLIDHSAPGPMSAHGLHPDVREALGSWVRRVVRGAP